jgi:hypothetical protein
VLVIGAWLLSAMARFAVRPHPHDVVQSTYSEHESLRHQAINGSFWRFFAKLEFILLMGASVYISMSLQMDWPYPAGAALLCVLGVFWLFA